MLSFRHSMCSSLVWLILALHIGLMTATHRPGVADNDSTISRTLTTSPWQNLAGTETQKSSRDLKNGAPFDEKKTEIITNDPLEVRDGVSGQGGVDDSKVDGEGAGAASSTVVSEEESALDMLDESKGVEMIETLEDVTGSKIESGADEKEGEEDELVNSRSDMSRGLSEEERQLLLTLSMHKMMCLQLALQDGVIEYGCHRAWDKVLCWPPTPPSTLAEQPCPDHVPNLNVHGEGNATRWCDENGVWGRNPKETTAFNVSTEHRFFQGWTNYSRCLHDDTNKSDLMDPLLKAWVPVITMLSIVGYSASLTLLVFSFIILVSFKKLRCPRNQLHLHLFGSFILRALVVLLRRSVFPPETTNHEVECRVMTVMWQYFILANYSWILMEGLYLYNLIFRALFTDSSAITLYVIMGWGLPVPVVAAWSMARAFAEDTHCWLVNNKLWIYVSFLRGPIATTIFLNFFFFIRVVRVLATKLNTTTNADSNSVKYRKLAKSTLVLVPLFGIHYFLLWGLSNSDYTPVLLAYLLLDQVCTSFQGFFAAILYCFMNGEVKQELKKVYYRYHDQDDTGNNATYSTVMTNTRSYFRLALRIKRPIFSRSRMSMPSIHADSDSKKDLMIPRSGRTSTSPSKMSQKSDVLSPVAEDDMYEMKQIGNYNHNENTTLMDNINGLTPTSTPSPHHHHQSNERLPLLTEQQNTAHASVKSFENSDDLEDINENNTMPQGSTNPDTNNHTEDDDVKELESNLVEQKAVFISLANTSTSLEAGLNHNNNVPNHDNLKLSQSVVKLRKDDSVAVNLFSENNVGGSL